jgi:hypothetical protein
MGSVGRRSVFVGALCTGVAMLGVSVHGLLGVDAELQRSAFAAHQQRSVEYHSVRVHEWRGDCGKPPTFKPGQRI